MRKIALAVMLAAFTAASIGVPVSSPALAAAKKKAKAKKAKAGHCGAYMYYNKKTRKCADARNKR